MKVIRSSSIIRLKVLMNTNKSNNDLFLLRICLIELQTMDQALLHARDTLLGHLIEAGVVWCEYPDLSVRQKLCNRNRGEN